MHFTRPPALITLFSRDLVWNMKPDANEVFLTFDDGPTPVITDRLLDLLEAYNAKSTFFCLGRQIDKYPELYRKVLDMGHRTGNHSYSHPSGWTTGNYTYYRDISRCKRLVESDLFRPPYGRISFAQIAVLKRKYKIIMWDVLSGDYVSEITSDQCIRNVLDHVRPGSIVVFHDNEKAGNRMLDIMPTILGELQHRKFVFRHL